MGEILIFPAHPRMLVMESISKDILPKVYLRTIVGDVSVNYNVPGTPQTAIADFERACAL